jgi:hypothetical protein
MKILREWRVPLIFLSALLVRLVLIHMHPPIFGGDTVLRLANRDKVFLAYQLPLLQAFIYGISQVFSGVLAVRYFMAFTGALAAVGFYKLAADFVDDRAALWAALLFASNPLLIQLSIVPFQEVPMLAALLFAFHFFFCGNLLAASIFIGLACLTRYEAWVGALVLAVAYYARSNRAPLEGLKALALFLWAPLGWFLLHHGFSSPGTFVIELPQSFFRLVRYVYLGWITVKNTPIPVLLLSVWGIWRIWKTGLRKQTNLLVLLVFLMLFAVGILFSAHGEAPDPERFVTAREAHLIIAAAVFCAGFALAENRKVAMLLAFAGIVLGVVDAHRFIERDTSQPAIQLSYELARFLDSTIKEPERVAMLVKPLPRQAVQDYLDKVRNRGGTNGLARAHEMMASMDISPPDCQRTRIQSGLGQRIVSFSPKPLEESTQNQNEALEIHWIVIWSDHVAGNAVETQLRDRAIASGPPIRVLTAGPLSATIYHLRP